MSRFEPLESVPLSGLSRATRFRHLDNGLQVIHSERPDCGVAAVQIWYRVGSGHEDPSATGLAHFFEHMMFRGTRTNGTGEYDRLLEELGCHGGTNAFTWKDFTAYVQEVPAGAVGRVLELEADRMSDLDLTPDNVNEEAGAVLDEKRLSLADPDSVRFDHLFETMHRDQAGAWPVLGYEDHIRAYTAESCQEFYRSWYAPNNACVIVCGDVRQEDLLTMVEESFGAFGSANDVPLRERRVTPGREHLRQDINLERLELNFGIPCDGSPWVWELAARTLALSEVGAFESALVEPGLTLMPHWWLGEVTGGEHLLHFSMTVLPDVSTETVETRVRDLMASCDQWLDDETLALARVDLDCDFANSCARLDDRATWLGEEWIYRRSLQACASRTDDLAAIGVEDLRQAVRGLAANDAFVLTAGPR